MDRSNEKSKKLDALDMEQQLGDKLAVIQSEKNKLIAQMIKIKETYNQLIEDEDLVQTMLMHQYNKAHRGAYMLSKMKQARERGIIE